MEKYTDDILTFAQCSALVKKYRIYSGKFY